MKLELKQRWLSGLRSDKYPQTTCTLHNTDGYCCLGVAAAIFAEEAGVSVQKKENNYRNAQVTSYDGSIDVLPEKLWKFLGISRDGTLPKPIQLEGWPYPVQNLMGLNDDARLTFKQIADIIEEQF